MISCPKPLRQHSLLACLLLAAVAWAVYRWLLFPDWRIFLHSDNIVPYLMTIEPWIPQDLYYWGAERFGAPYPVLWKALGHPLCGASPLAFYACFFACFFIGSAFWLRAIRSWPLGLAFFAIMLPLMPERVDEFLYPGHVYGTLYALYGFISYLLLLYPGINRRQGRVLGVACALTYWQHPLAGFIAVYLVLLKYVCSRTPSDGKLRQLSAPFWGTGLLCLVPIEIGRFYATKWDHPVYGKFENWQHFKENFADFCNHGLSFELGATFGLTLFAVLLIATPLGVWARRAGKGERYERLFVASVFAIGCACILFFNAHGHYRQNLRHERYFSFIIPMIFLALARLPRVAPHRLVGWFAVAAFALLTGLAGERELVDRRGSLFDPAELDRRAQETSVVDRTIATLEQVGCSGVVDGYWQAYRMAGLSGGQLPASAGDHVRNPVYLERVLSGSSVCVAAGMIEQRAVKPHLAARACRRVELDYWLCPAKPL